MLRGGMVPALVDGVLKVHCLLRREQRYEEAQHTMIIVLLQQETYNNIKTIRKGN